MSFWSTIKNAFGDVTKGIEEVVPGARNIDRFLNKAGIGPQDFLQNPFKPQGWAGDIEHGASQFSHSPAGRSLEEMAAIAAMAYFAPELIGTMSGDFSAADMAAIQSAGAEYGGATAADAATSYGVDLGAETASAGTDIPGAATTAAAAGAPTATANMLPEVTVNAPAMASGVPLTGQIVESSVAPQLLAGTAGVAQAAAAQSYGTEQNTAPGGPDPLAGTPLGAPSLLNPMDVQISDPMAGMPSGFQPGGSFVPPDPSSGDLASPPSQWDQWKQFLTTPKGELSALSMGAGLYSLMNRAKLPGYATQAGAAAGPASAQAQTMLASGGQGSPLWGQQKSAIDAQIDQQIQNFSRAAQQNAQNQGQGGSNSLVVQQQIAQITSQLEAQRQSMYMAAQQQNVNNAVAELTGANQTLMALANLQFQEDQQAQQLARNVGLVTGNLASMWPSTTPS